MTLGGRVLGLFLGSTVALLACSSDKSPGSSSSSGAAGSVSAAGAASSSAGSAGSSAGAAGSLSSAGSTATDQGGGGSAQMQTDPCENGMKDGSESDVDCGSDCSQCANGKTCVAFSDCSSSHCVDGTCQECAPNATQCDGNKVATCTEGKWVDAATDCPNGCDVNSSMCKP